VRRAYGRTQTTTQPPSEGFADFCHALALIPESEPAADSATNTAEGKFDADQGGDAGLRAAVVPEARFRARRSRVTAELLAASSTDPDSAGRFTSPST
jgi:hypothetical protein